MEGWREGSLFGIVYVITMAMVKFPAFFSYLNVSDLWRGDFS